MTNGCMHYPGVLHFGADIVSSYRVGGTSPIKVLLPLHNMPSDKNMSSGFRFIYTFIFCMPSETETINCLTLRLRRITRIVWGREDIGTAQMRRSERWGTQAGNTSLKD